MPNSIKFFFDDDWNNFTNYDDLFKHFWTASESFIVCDGFKLVGMQTWITLSSFGLLNKSVFY